MATTRRHSGADQKAASRSAWQGEQWGLLFQVGSSQTAPKTVRDLLSLTSFGYDAVSRFPRDNRN